MSAYSPLIVALGGTPRPNSSTETALAAVLKAAEAAGAQTRLFGGVTLAGFPVYSPEDRARTPEQVALVEAVGEADGVIIGSPGYHGGVSGLVKNAIDLLEDLAKDRRPYLHNRAVGLVATGAGWQATATTLASLRSIVHALRGWPTPLGVALNTSGGLFDAAGNCTDAGQAAQLATVGHQVVEFAHMFRGRAAALSGVATLERAAATSV